MGIAANEHADNSHRQDTGKHKHNTHTNTNTINDTYTVPYTCHEADVMTNTYQ